MSTRKYTYDYPHPALTSDCVVFGFDEGELKLLLLQRANAPAKGSWALPGGCVHIKETTEAAARRVLEEKVGVGKIYLEQLYTFSEIDRDPRERVISVAYYALVKLADYKVKAGRDTENAEWFAVSQVPKLAFDHNHIVKVAIARLRGKVRYQPVGFELLPAKFTLTQLQHLYEAILGVELDKRNFRKKILGMGLLTGLDEKEKNVAHKAARFYSFDKKTYKELSAKGFNFEL
jgi:8-oxo-dGTP diphosphatase